MFTALRSSLAIVSYFLVGLFLFFVIPVWANEPTKTVDDVLVEVVPFRIFTISEPEDCEWGSGLLDCVYEDEDIEVGEPLYIRNGEVIEIDLEKYTHAFINSTTTPDNFESYLPQDENETDFCNQVSYYPDDYNVRKLTDESNSATLENDDWWGGVVWQGGGEYELDIYAGCVPNLTFQSPSLFAKLLAFISPKVALAHWFENELLGTFSFTVIDTNAEPVTECCSSVLFLPGIMGSKLHNEEGDKLWEPSAEGDIQNLYLDENGKSVDGVESGEVIATFAGPLVFNIDLYKSFLADLETKKQEGFLADYLAYGYDWRLSLEDILADETLANELRELSQDSKNGKVTIVAHSNGGLLAKALINQLGDEAPELVDNLIMVGVPQLGTPQAIGALLHGFDSGIPFLYSDALARDFAQNAPFTYNLLPHNVYYNSVGATISQPLVTFDDGEATQLFIDKYGYGITNATELTDFLLGAENRNTPAFDDLINPTKANANLLTQAENEYSAIDAVWSPPSGIKVHQIAGVGIPTVAGIKYGTVKDCLSVQLNDDGLWHCDYSGENKLAYAPVRVLDGDKTVIEPSALVMSENENVTRWWVDLQSYNKKETNKQHRDILEVSNLRSFIFDSLLSTSTETYTYISMSKPNLSNTNRLSFTLHSPLSLSYIENDGTIVNEQNPVGNYSEYSSYGEVQIIDIFGEEGQGSITMNGEATGSFTLEIEEFSGNNTVFTTTYSGIPTATSSIVTLEVFGAEVGKVGTLKVDYNGDNQTDFELQGEVGTVTNMATTSSVEEIPDEIISTSTSSGSGGSYRPNVTLPAPQVAGVSTDDFVTAKILIEILVRLESLKEEIDSDAYNMINHEARRLLADILQRYEIFN